MQSPVKDKSLSEWSSKIKAMQQQVDADEDQEHKRLEQEIAASRLARQRRSRGLGRDSLDLSKHKEYASALNDVAEPSDLKPIVDRQSTQADTLRMLNGEASPRTTSPPPEKKPESMSLAAFMGGRATGPRLNRHAGQQDAHDPTQFDQTRATPSAPHPIFGRGGIAMPGMAPTSRPPGAKAAFSASPQGSYRDRAPTSPIVKDFGYSASKTPLQQQKHTLSTPFGAKVAEPKVNVIAPQKTGPRERTMSTPSGPSPSRSGDSLAAYTPSARTPSPSRVPRPSPPGSPLSEAAPKAPLPRSHSPTPYARESRPKTPVTEQRARSKSRTREPTTTRAKTPTRSPSSPRQPATPSLSYTSPRPTSSIPTPTKSSAIPVSVPSLARAVRPEPRNSLGGPRIPSTANPSAAFLRSPGQKEPTPSISRLQGRGFVQNMVKASSQLSPAPASPTFANTGGFSPSTKSAVVEPSRRMSSVLDRWPAAASSSPPQSSPPTPAPTRKSRTVEDSPGAAWARSKARASTPVQEREKELEKEKPTPTARRKSIPGVGSSSTMISYIKPTKTGDDDQPMIVPLAEALHLPEPLYPDDERENVDVDELGMRGGKSGSLWESPVSRGSPLPATKGSSTMLKGSPASSPGKPLSHPTKDRAKRPRKEASTPTTSKRTTTTTSPQSEPSIIEQVAGIASPEPSKAFVPPAPSASDVKSSVPSVNNAFTPSLPAPRPVEPIRSPSPSKPTRVTDRWTEQRVIIGVKPTHTAVRKPVPEVAPKPAGMVGRVGLPGMTGVAEFGGAARNGNGNGSGFRVPAPKVVELVPKPEVVVVQEKSKDATPPRNLEERRPPLSPMRHGRIPSTGNRATVMDVAQALNDREDEAVVVEACVPSPSPSPSPPPPPAPAPEPVVEEVVMVEEAELQETMSVPAARPRNVTPYPAPPSLADKRRSSLDKYSAIILPVLHEEKTPLSSPAGTLNRGYVLDPVQESRSSLLSKDLTHGLESLTAVPEPIAQPESSFRDVDIEALCKPTPVPRPLGEDVATISVDLMAIIGTTASAITRDTNIFYDNEVLAIVHRFKSKSTGLVKTEVWGWKGKRSQFGDREERKLHDLAKRYGSVLQIVPQHSEPAYMVHVIGGQLAIRQGTRAHWSSENTAMHLVRSTKGVIFIDEHDLNVKNLCSGYSYCLSVLDTIYVWYGVGSKEAERQAALKYARALAPDNNTLIELAEGQEGDDEMFWMILGDEDHAKADYWRWRRASENVEPRVWRVDSASKDVIIEVASLAAESINNHVYIMDLHWELFVLVGARSGLKRDSTRLAVSVARQISACVAAERPFSPTVHTLALPTQLPVDLRLAFRDLDEEQINGGSIPDHMLLYTAGDTFDQIRRGSFPANPHIDFFYEVRRTAPVQRSSLFPLALPFDRS